jgi:C4-dicarboxylate-specific signal transduction histidine kinase
MLGYKKNSNSTNTLERLSPLLLDLQSYFLQIWTLTETGNIKEQSSKEIRLLSKHALIMLDYALFTIDESQAELALTTLSASAAIQDVTENLRSLAASYNVDLDLDITNQLEPIYTNDTAVKGVLYGLISNLITNHQPTDKRLRLVIAAQETSPHIQRLGVYSPDTMVSLSSIRHTRKLVGQAKSVAPLEIHNSGLGLVISDQLTIALGSRLRRFTHRQQKGIGFYVPISTQLSFL